MWKREEAAKPVVPSAPPANLPAPGAGPAPAQGRPTDREVNIGKSVVIKGELNGSEDLTIEGQVEGKIELREHVLTIGPHGRIRAEVFAKVVVVLGEVVGNIKATDKVTILDKGAVDGDITAPKIAIAEGARFRGSVDMSSAGQQGLTQTGAEHGGPAPSSKYKPVADASTPVAAAKDAPPPKAKAASTS